MNNRSTEAPRQNGRLMTAQQLARELGVPYTTARDLLLRGTIPRIEIPGLRRLLCERREVERLVESWKEREAR